MFQVFQSENYYEKLNKLDNTEKNRIIKFEQELKENPFNGKPLGFKFLREKKFNGKRILYLIYNPEQIIFLITITDKKAQKQDINHIKCNIKFYKEIIKEKIKFFSLFLLKYQLYLSQYPQVILYLIFQDFSNVYILSEK